MQNEFEISMQKIISEFGIIRYYVDSHENEDNFNEIFLTERHFNSLKELCFSDKNQNLLQYSTKRGKEQIQIKNYVGVLEIKDLTLEILPKIGKNSEKEARRALLKMLRALPNSPFKTLGQAHLNLCHLPLIEIFIYAFFTELENLLRGGLIHSFENVENSQNFMKGKLNFSEQLKRNHINSHQFHVSFDEFSPNFSLNKIIQSTLIFLEKQHFHQTNRILFQRIIEIFNEIEPSENLEKDFAEFEKHQQLYGNFKTLISWCKIFLSNRTFMPSVGSFRQSSLLFPTEILFENFVGKSIKKHFSDSFEVNLKTSSKHLIENHLERPKFRLIPDILLKTQSESVILDTKWKIIDSTKIKQNYGIEQTDLYQIYAYGKKYDCRQLFLVYPAHENFRKPLQVFDYEHNMSLIVLPFDVSNEVETEAEKIKKHIYSS